MEQSEIIVGLLGKLGVENASALDPERAKAKLNSKLRKVGIPSGLSFEEMRVLSDMGFASISEVKDQPKKEVAIININDNPEWDTSQNCLYVPTPEGFEMPEGYTVVKCDEDGNPVEFKEYDKEGKPKKGRPRKSAMKEPSALSIFRKVMRGLAPDKNILKKELINSLVNAGVKRDTACIYVSWAKRPRRGTSVKNNPTGVFIQEFKDSEGKKWLSKIRNL